MVTHLLLFFNVFCYLPVIQKILVTRDSVYKCEVFKGREREK
jgi:hypothetical protein